MENCSSAKLPIDFGYKISADLTYKSVDQHIYLGMIPDRK